MIHHFTIKAAPAASQKDFQKKLFDGTITPQEILEMSRQKCRVEFIGDYEDITKVAAFLKELSKHEA